MITLGLDLGQNIGWVKGGPVGPLEHGSFPMPNTTDLGLWLQGSDALFRKILPGCTGVAVEQPFLGDSYFPARKLLALLGHVYYWGRVVGIAQSQFKEVAISTGKKTLSGYGRADKDQMIAAAAALGYEGYDEHEADALGVWWVYVFGEAEALPSQRSRSGPGKVIKP